MSSEYSESVKVTQSKEKMFVPLWLSFIVSEYGNKETVMISEWTVAVSNFGGNMIIPINNND